MTYLVKEWERIEKKEKNLIAGPDVSKGAAILLSLFQIPKENEVHHVLPDSPCSPSAR